MAALISDMTLLQGGARFQTRQRIPKQMQAGWDCHEQAYQEEIDLPNHSVLQVISTLVVFKLNVQAVLDADFHLQGT